MADKTAFPGVSRYTGFDFYPEELTIITDPSHELFDERALESFKETLVASIMAIGLVEPVIIRKNGRDENGVPIAEVLVGRHRVKAIAEVNRRLELAGKPRMKVRTIQLSENDEKELIKAIISENEIRFPDPPSIKARKLYRLIQRGATEQEAATTFGIKIAECKKLLKLMELHKDAATAIDEGRLSLSAASKLVGLSRSEQKKLLESLAADGGKITAERIEESRSIQPGADGGIPAPQRPKMRTRKEIEALLDVWANESGEYGSGAHAALSWVLRQEDPKSYFVRKEAESNIVNPE